MTTSKYIEANEISDIFDGELYKHMVQREFFQDERDIALLATADCYQLFHQKTEENWIIIFINGNLPLD